MEIHNSTERYYLEILNLSSSWICLRVLYSYMIEYAFIHTYHILRLTYIFNIMFVHCVASKMVLQIRLDNPNIFKIPKLNFIATENKLIKWMRWKKLTLEIIKMKNNFIDKWEIFSSSFVCCVLLLIYAN